MNKEFTTFVFIEKQNNGAIVAEGVQFSNGYCVVAWLNARRFVTTYNSIEELWAHNPNILVEPIKHLK